MRKKGFLIPVAVVSSSMLLAACGQSMPELTAEEYNQVVEYSAELLLKYDANYQSRLLSEEEEKAEEAKLDEKAKRAAELEAAVEKAANARESRASQSRSGGKAEAERKPATMEELYGLDGMSVRYTGYQILDSYPEESGGNSYFALDATEGKKLLVMSFQVTNTSGADQELDMLSRNPKFKVSVNGGSSRNVLLTMLSDDLRTFKGVIASGTSQNLVIVAEIPAQEAGSVSTLELTMGGGSGSGTMVLEGESL